MKEWTAADLLALSSAYWPSALVQTGVRLDLFTLLDGPAQTGRALAAATGCNERGLAMLLTALTAAELLAVQKPDGETDTGPASFAHCMDTLYTAPASTVQYMSRKSPEYLGFIIDHHYHLQPAWHQLGESVRLGKGMRVSSSDTEEAHEREAFLMGMFNIAVQQAENIARHLDLSGRKRLLDVGGGPGTYAVYFCRQNPDLQATIFDKPTSRPYAESIVNRYGLSSRIDFVGGDFDTGELPRGYDVAWISQILHGTSPEGAAEIVAKAARSLKPRGLLCIQEFMLDDNLEGPLFPALFSLNMLVGTDGGQAYTRSELMDMMHRAGVKDARQLQIQLPQGCAVLVGEMPG